MMQYLLTLLLLFFITSCSFQTPPNQWQHQSASAFSAYTQDFLSADDLLAKNDLARAIHHAKQSANLSTLARIYLGKCALNISVGVEDKCQEYKNISSLVDDAKLQEYYEFIIKRSDAKAKDVLDMSRDSSKLLNGALHKEHLDDASREKLLSIASYHGYKKAVLFWLQESLHHSSDAKKRAQLQKRIDILNNP